MNTTNKLSRLISVNEVEFALTLVVLHGHTIAINPDGSPRTDGIYRNRGTGAFTIGPDKVA